MAREGFIQKTLNLGRLVVDDLTRIEGDDFKRLNKTQFVNEEKSPGEHGQIKEVYTVLRLKPDTEDRYHGKNFLLIEYLKKDEMCLFVLNL